MRYVIILALALGSSFNKVAVADHTDPQGSVGLLSSETQDLDQLVGNSSLNYNVLSAVNRFSYDVARLVDCVLFRGGDRSHLDDHTGDVGCPARCRSYLNNARSSFSPVDRFLYDTQYDYPQIYHQYLEVRRAIYSIAVGPGPGPQPQTRFRCTSVDTGWEEHNGGHVAFGAYLQSAQQNSIYECRRYHSRCRVSHCEQIH